MAPRRRVRDTVRPKRATAQLSKSSISKAISQPDIGNSPWAEKRDPDPFTAICMVIAGVAGIAQIIHTAHDLWPSRKTSLKQLSEFATELENDIEDVIRDIERLHRVLRKHDSVDGQPVLLKPNRFGAAPMALDTHDFDEYERKVGDLASDVRKLNHRVIGAIRFHPEFARDVGAGILESLSDISDRINRLRDVPIGEAMELSVEMLRECGRIVQRLTTARGKN